MDGLSPLSQRSDQVFSMFQFLFFLCRVKFLTRIIFLPSEELLLPFLTGQVSWQQIPFIFVCLKESCSPLLLKGNFTEYCHCSLKTGSAQMFKEVKPNQTNHMHRALPVILECMLLSPLKPLQPSFLTSCSKARHHGSFLPSEALI